MATLPVIKIIPPTLKPSIGGYVHLSCATLPSFHSCQGDREHSKGFHGVFSRKVQTNLCSSHHLQDTTWILRGHNRMKIGSFIVIVLCEKFIAAFYEIY